MSVNKYTTAEGLVTLANGSRMWVGTKAAYEAARQAGTMPTDVLVAITDDEVSYDHYSTDETFTGMYWIDGKKIYRKVVDTGALPDSTNKAVAHNVSNIDTIIKTYGFAYSTDANKTTIPLPYTNAGGTNVVLYANKNTIYLKDTENLSSGYPYSYSIIEYTKTND